MFHEMQNLKCLHLGKIKHFLKYLAFCLQSWRNLKTCHYNSTALQVTTLKGQGDLAFSFYLDCCCFSCCLFVVFFAVKPQGQSDA